MADTLVRLFVFVLVTGVALYGLTLIPDALYRGDEPPALLFLLGLGGMLVLTGTTIARHCKRPIEEVSERGHVTGRADGDGD
jgi:hypothetical protein